MQKWIAETTYKGSIQAPFPICAPSFNAAVSALTKDGYEIQSLVMCVALDPVINEQLMSMTVSQKETNLAVVDLLTAMQKSQKDTNDRLMNISTAMGSRGFYLQMRTAVCWGIIRCWWLLCVLFPLILWLLWTIVFQPHAFSELPKNFNGSVPYTGSPR